MTIDNIEGIQTAAIGILTAIPGASPATGETRWTFGLGELDDGFKLLPVLIGLFAVNSTMIWFGALQERYARPGAGASRLPFWFGTAAGLVPWAVIAVYLLQDAGSVPTFVFAIFGVEAVLFSSFGLNQWLQYRGVGPWSDYAFGEKAYLVLSLGAKSALAWQIYGGSLGT